MSECRSIPGWPRYRVTTDGDVYSTRGQIMRPYEEASGHWAVRLYVNSRPRKYGIHQLVLLTFEGPCPEGMEVRHLNGNPKDNRLSNLRYGTRSENVRDSIQHGTNVNSQKTHCPRGHALTAPNLDASVARRGGRGCRACALARAAVFGRPELDLAVVAANRYERIMANA